jgi:hypothetical protein
MATMLFGQDRPERTSLFGTRPRRLATYVSSTDKGAVIRQVLALATRRALFGVKLQLFIDLRKICGRSASGATAAIHRLDPRRQNERALTY